MNIIYWDSITIICSKKIKNLIIGWETKMSKIFDWKQTTFFCIYVNNHYQLTHLIIKETIEGMTLKQIKNYAKKNFKSLM